MRTIVLAVGVLGLAVVLLAPVWNRLFHRFVQGRLAAAVDGGALVVEAVAPEQVPAACHEPSWALNELGFGYVLSAVSKPGRLPPMYSVFLLDAPRTTYCRISMVGNDSGAPTTTLCTRFMDGRVLETLSIDKTVAFPDHLSQLMPDQPLAAMAERHRSRLGALTGDGLVAQVLEPGSLLELFREEWQADVQGLRAYGIRTTST